MRLSAGRQPWAARCTNVVRASLAFPARHLRRQPVGCLALVIALTGTSYAAVRLPARSVGTKQLRNGAVTQSKVSLAAARSLQAAAGPAGAIGPAGPVGPLGPAGPQGPTAHPTQRNAEKTVAGNSYEDVVAYCSADETVVAGGYDTGQNMNVVSSDPVLGSADPTGRDSWNVGAWNNGAQSVLVRAFAICIKR